MREPSDSDPNRRSRRRGVGSIRRMAEFLSAALRSIASMLLPIGFAEFIMRGRCRVSVHAPVTVGAVYDVYDRAFQMLFFSAVLRASKAI